MHFLQNYTTKNSNANKHALIPAFTASFAICTTSGECDAIFSASCTASLTTWSAGNTLLTRPGQAQQMQQTQQETE